LEDDIPQQANVRSQAKARAAFLRKPPKLLQNSYFIVQQQKIVGEN
jgi:hypothetical protein